MALTAIRDTPEKQGAMAMSHEQGVAATANVFQGALLAVDANGFIEPGTTATGLIAAGSALENADNTTGADGDITVKFRSGIFKYDNDGGTPVTQADVGRQCFILDDETVSGDPTGRSVAGTVYQVDGAGAPFGGAGVWVAIAYPIGS